MHIRIYFIYLQFQSVLPISFSLFRFGRLIRLKMPAADTPGLIMNTVRKSRGLDSGAGDYGIKPIVLVGKGVCYDTGGE